MRAAQGAPGGRPWEGLRRGTHLCLDHGQTVGAHLCHRPQDVHKLVFSGVLHQPVQSDEGPRPSHPRAVDTGRSLVALVTPVTGCTGDTGCTRSTGYWLHCSLVTLVTGYTAHSLLVALVALVTLLTGYSGYTDYRLHCSLVAVLAWLWLHTHSEATHG